MNFKFHSEDRVTIPFDMDALSTKIVLTVDLTNAESMCKEFFSFIHPDIDKADEISILKSLVKLVKKIKEEEGK